MGFKLGSERGNNFVSGEVKNKLRFSKEAGGDASLPGTPVIRKNLGTDIMGEANMDGSIYISKSITPGSFEERQVINHEMVHATQIRTGKLEYDDNFVKYDGVTYPRETRNGRDMIKVDGKWTEAGGDFPWERDANYGNS
jgi:hypothetical protein|tara:strand:- start:242 stop:661 length:420 start_codon:yes stop_codon:yes gene_type:complete